MPSKVCRRCGTKAPIEHFYAHKFMKDGHLNICITCTKRRVSKHRSLNDSVREYDNKRGKLPHRKALAKRTNERINKEHPLKYKAHYTLTNAVRDKRIVKPHKCSVCGLEKRLTGHHEDYTKPLDVIWMCFRCHAIHHSKKDIMTIDCKNVINT